MRASLHLAGAGDLAQLEPLVAAFHAEMGIASDADHRMAALDPLLNGLPQGAIYLIGPRKAPIGYIVLSFGYSVASGGLVCTIDEFFIRRNVRRRGIGTEVLMTLVPQLSEYGVKSLTVTTGQEDQVLPRVFLRSGFKPRKDAQVLIRDF